jgi:tetratricopeptide (TPR) repeat protein
MKTTHGLLLALGAAVLATTAAGDLQAQRGRGRAAGSESLPQVTCASGANPGSAGTFATAAQGALNRTLIPNLPAAQKTGFYQQAYDQASQGITADANNPFNYFLAAQASAGLGQPARADSMFQKTVQLCPEFASEVTPARAQLAEQAMESARVALVDHSDTTAAIAGWTLAAQLDSTNIDANFYAGYFSLLKGDNDRAMPVFRRILAMPAPAATDTNGLERRDVAVRAVLSYGGQLFNQDHNPQAVEVLNSVRAADPQNHDAAYWTSLALYKLQRWNDLATATTRAVELGPLNYNAFMLLHDAHKMMADALKAQGNAAQEAQHRQQAMAAQAAGEALPVQVEQVSLSTTGTTTTVRGVVVGGKAAAGTPVRIEFHLSTPSGDVGSGTVSVVAPAAGANANFELPVQVTAAPTGFRYRLLP